ncbi:MAG: hypothetical protein AB1898_09260 [Acidobacteriota bacterium]
MRSIRFWCAVLTLLASLLVAATSLHAFPITFEFSGTTLFHFDGTITQNLEAPYQGTFTFDSDGLDLFPADPELDRYEFSGLPYGVTLDIDGHHFEYDSVTITVFPHWLTGSREVTRFDVVSSGSDHLLNLNLFNDNLLGSATGDQNTLPVRDLFLTSYPIFKFHFQDSSVGSYTGENVDSVRALPELSAASMLFLGFLVLCGVRVGKPRIPFRNPPRQ